MGAVRDLVSQVRHPSPIARELLVQMCVIAFALGIVLAAGKEASDAHDDGWSFFFGVIFGGLVYLYGRTSCLWYTFLD